MPQPPPPHFLIWRISATEQSWMALYSPVRLQIGWVFSSPLCSTCITFITIHNIQPANFFSTTTAAMHGIYPWLTMVQFFVHTSIIATEAVRFYFSLTGVKGLMEGLNKLCYVHMVHVFETMNIQACMGYNVSSISASWSRSKLKN